MSEAATVVDNNASRALPDSSGGSVGQASTSIKRPASVQCGSTGLLHRLPAELIGNIARSVVDAEEYLMLKLTCRGFTSHVSYRECRRYHSVLVDQLERDREGKPY